MRKNKLILIAVLFFAFSFFSFDQYCQAQSSGGSSISGASDAIGVRVVPNPNHYSIGRWYESQGFQGSPQSLIVDGYEAIRDGRTVYVNAANVEQNKIYTNIYLISYNQDPAVKTVDVLGQIVSHWKFNSNINESANPAPSCSISSLICSSDRDCGKEQVCATSTGGLSSSLYSGFCVLKDRRNCLTDADCPSNFFCDSIKAKVSRDINRVGKLEELKEALFAFKQANNHYPVLSSGSYLANHSVSVWPSWTQEFLSELGVVKNFSDPINRLGPCWGYDSKTCWDEKTKRFIYNPTPTYLMLPAGSYAFVYQTDTNGSDYNICAVMETREPALNYQFFPNNPTSSACVTAIGIISGGQATNTAPILIEKSLTGEAGREFNGSLKVFDQEGNPLTWALNTTGANWSSWSQAPVLQESNSPEQRRIYAARAGNPGDYSTILTVSDGQGGVLSTATPIKIINPVPFIEADDEEYAPDPAVPLIYNFYFSDNNISNPSVAYNVSLVSGPNVLSGLNQSLTTVGVNRYKVTYNGLLNPGNYNIFKDLNAVYRVSVTDAYGGSASKQFTIRLLAENPELNFNCPTDTRQNKNYSCLLGFVKEGNHTLSYSSSPLPTGLQLVTTSTIAKVLEAETLTARQTWLNKVFSVFNFKTTKAASAPPTPVTPLKALIKGQATIASSTGYKITVKATNEYGASSTRDFILHVNNYCGDGIKQLPNFEGRGGFYNDGYEDCDGADGVTSSVSYTPDVQYACVTEAGAATPDPILNNNYCIFKSPADGGGYCGDGDCHGVIENLDNCPQDCAHTCSPAQNCTGKECGSDGCGGYCGYCSAGQSCNSSGQCVTNCQPNCTGKECGSDGCGGSCGTCPTGKKCDPTNKCVNNSCIPDCVNKTCGPDGCGGTCGTCTFPKQCKANGICCDADCKQCIGGLSSYSWQPCGNECCNENTQICCGNICRSKTQYQKCGSTCCDLSNYVCCGTTCRANTWEPCGNTCCQPGKYCCPYTHACVAEPHLCNTY